MPAQATREGQQQRRAKRKGKSNNPQRYVATAWGKNKAATIELRVPSGQLCLVRTVGIPGLIEAGILDQVDSLTSIVDAKFIKHDDAGVPSIDIPGVSDSAGAIKNIMEIMAATVCLAVVEPKVYEVPMVLSDPDNPDSTLVEGEREEGKVYVDTVDEEDQVFIFQAVAGGTQDLEQFRQRVEELVDGLDVVEQVDDQAE